MHCLSKEFLNNKYYKLHHVSVIDAEKMYVIKNLEDKNWYRVKIVKIWDENTAEIEFIDFGKSGIVKRKNLVLLENLSKFLINYPAQVRQKFTYIFRSMKAFYSIYLLLLFLLMH